MQTDLTNTTYFFESLDKIRKIFYQKHHTTHSAESKGSLVITHGLGEHSDAYSHISQEIAATLPLDVISWDMVGHGKSSGQRGYVGDISWMIKDLAQLLSIVSKETKKPIYLLSHSLGGLITLTAEQNGLFKDLNIKGIILSNPCTKLNFDPPKWKILGANFLTKFAPKITLGNELSPEQLSSDASYLAKHKSDSLRHSKISPRLFLGMIELIESLKKQDKSAPTLSLLSVKDSICNPKNSENLLKNRSKILFFDNSLHEVLNDIEKDTAIEKIKEFLNENI